LGLAYGAALYASRTGMRWERMGQKAESDASRAGREGSSQPKRKNRRNTHPGTMWNVLSWAYRGTTVKGSLSW